MHILFESVLMLFTQNYQNQSMFDDTAACQSWLVFFVETNYAAVSMPNIDIPIIPFDNITLSKEITIKCSVSEYDSWR